MVAGWAEPTDADAAAEACAVAAVLLAKVAALAREQPALTLLDHIQRSLLIGVDVVRHLRNDGVSVELEVATPECDRA